MAAARAPITLYKLSGLNSSPLEHGKEAASQTYKGGALLVEASGKVQECAADPAKVLGVAQYKASGVTDNDNIYTHNQRGAQFAISLDDSSALGTGAIAATDRHAAYGVAKDANGIWYLDKAETSVKVMEIIDFIGDVGEVMGRVIAEFVPVTID